MWVLYLNPMRDRAEARRAVARAETRGALEAFLARERVEDYRDDEGGKSWLKVYRRGGPLEWFNPPEASAAFFPSFVDCGSLDGWLRRAREVWDRLEATIPLVPSE